MNRRQRSVQQAFLDNEQAILRRLEMIYTQALQEVNESIERLMMRPDADMQHVIYQVEYQKALRQQISAILDVLHTNQFSTISEYITQCYENGFVGTMYDLSGQGIPLILPINQEAVVQAVQLESKISEGLYKRLGECVTLLRHKIMQYVSRGIATGMSYQQIAQQLAAHTKIGYSRAFTIAQTEGHRVIEKASMDACYAAKEKGADIVKQWDATMDKKTRPSHQRVDGEIRELDEPFSNGLMYPGDPDGPAGEVIRCRCTKLQRARWALDEAELETLKKRAAYFGLDKEQSFDEFREKYAKAAAQMNEK